MAVSSLRDLYKSLVGETRWYGLICCPEDNLSILVTNLSSGYHLHKRPTNTYTALITPLIWRPVTADQVISVHQLGKLLICSLGFFRQRNSNLNAYSRRNSSEYRSGAAVPPPPYSMLNVNPDDISPHQYRRDLRCSPRVNSFRHSLREGVSQHPFPLQWR